MRVLNSIKNVSVAIISYVLAMLIGIVSQSVLVRYLGIEYNGINGLFTNIISMLSIAELGIGSAVVYHLYKPIAENDKDKIKSLMNFYKIAYRWIALIITVIGFMIIPFLKGIVGETTIKENIYLIFILFLADTVFSYLLTYKRSLLYADQKNYIINIVHILYTILLNALQIFIMMFTKNYILYLILRIVFRILENVIITIIVNRRYLYILEKDAQKIDQNIFKDIMQKIKALIFHKIGGYIVDGTDNIVISSFLGISTVGIYANYRMIIVAVSTVISQIFNALTASVGNLLVGEKEEKVYETYNKLSLLNYFIYYIGASVLYATITIMVKIIYGESYIIDGFTVFIIIVTFYLQGMKKNIQLFKEAACIFYEDRFVPLIEAIVNIVASVILVQTIGLAGVFIGTIISTLVVFLYSYPKYVYHTILNRRKREYIYEQLKYLIIFLTTIFILTICFKFIKINNIFINLIINLIISGVFSLTSFILIYHKTDAFLYYKEFILDIIRKIKAKKCKGEI